MFHKAIELESDMNQWKRENVGWFQYKNYKKENKTFSRLLRRIRRKISKKNFEEEKEEINWERSNNKCNHFDIWNVSLRLVW